MGQGLPDQFIVIFLTRRPCLLTFLFDFFPANRRNKDSLPGRSFFKNYDEDMVTDVVCMDFSVMYNTIT